MPLYKNENYNAQKLLYFNWSIQILQTNDFDPCSKCTNKSGSHKCSCGTGYIGNGKQCVKSKCPSLREVPNLEIESCTATSCT